MALPAPPPGVTLNQDANGNITGYTFQHVYTGSEASSPTGGQIHGDFSGVGPTAVFTDNITLNSGATTVVDGNVIDNRLLGTSGTGVIFRPLISSNFAGAPLTVNDDDGVLSSTRAGDSTGETTAGQFRWTGDSVTPPRYIPAGSEVVVRGEIQFQLMTADSVPRPVPGAPTITGYILATPNANGTYNNFGMATSHDIEALVAQYRLGGVRLKVIGTKPPADLPVCFSADALIETDHGPVRAGDLEVGDLVRTRDAGLQPIRWIGKNAIDMLALTQKGVRPIRSSAGALGDGMPSSDLVVSPQHRVLVRSKIARKMFGTDEVLVAAKQLLQIDGVNVATDLMSVTYVHFLFDDHQIVFSNGAETESLHTGEQALKTVGDAAVQEIFTIFPELAEGAERPAARLVVSGRQGRRLAVRHKQNDRALVN